METLREYGLPFLFHFAAQVQRLPALHTQPNMSDKRIFVVTVSRTTYTTKDYIVEAYAEDDATDAAIIEAYNDEWQTGNAEYEADHVALAETLNTTTP